MGRLGWSLRRIQQELGVRRETASTYLKAEGITVQPPGRRRQEPAAKPAITANQVTTDSESPKPAISEVTTDSVAAQPVLPPTVADGNRSPSTSTCEPFREAIELGLSQGRNAMGIWQDLISQTGFSGGYQTVKRFVRKLRGGQTPVACAIIVTAAGEEAQVDYGSGPMVRDPQTGKYRRTRLFVLTLGYSRKSVRLLTFRSSTRTWAELHEKAFRRLGGSTQVVVLTPDIYDPGPGWKTAGAPDDRQWNQLIRQTYRRHEDMRHADDVQRMMLILISEPISNSNAVIRQEFRKRHFPMIDNKNFLSSSSRSASLS